MRIQRCLKSVILSIQAQHCQLVVGVGCPLCSVLRDLTSSTECSWGATLQGGHETIREHPKENCKDGEGLAGKGCEERLRLCSAQSRGAEGRPRGGCSSSQGAEGSAELCSVWQRQGLRGWHGAVPGEGGGARERLCPRGWWARPQWRSSGSTGTVLSAIGFGFGCCCVEPGFGVSDPCVTLPTQDILWFYDKKAGSCREHSSFWDSHAPNHQCFHGTVESCRA